MGLSIIDYMTGITTSVAILAALQADVAAHWTDFASIVVKGSRFMKMERVVEALMSQDRADNRPQNNKKGEAHAA